MQTKPDRLRPNAIKAGSGVVRGNNKIAFATVLLAVGFAGTAAAQTSSVQVIRGFQGQPVTEWPPSQAPVKTGQAPRTNTTSGVPATGWAPTTVRSTVVVRRGPGAEPPQMVSPLQTSRYGAVPTAVLPHPPRQPMPKPVPDDGSARSLHLVNFNTGESIIATYWASGRYVPGELARLDYFLRDNRSGLSTQMDPQLFDLLVFVQRQLGSGRPIEILSAYRSPETNAWLASVSRGVARDSQHIQGNAIDIRIADRTPAQIRAAALALGMGGVGFYPRSGFVHVDTGPIRQW